MLNILVGDDVIAKHVEYFVRDGVLDILLRFFCRGRRPRRPGLNKMRYQFYSLTLTLSSRARGKTSAAQTSRG